MKKFDFRRLFGNIGNNSSDSTSKQRGDKQRRGRQCRIEELEGREMLSATPWTLANDVFYGEPVSPVVEVSCGTDSWTVFDANTTILADAGNSPTQSFYAYPRRTTSTQMSFTINIDAVIDKNQQATLTLRLNDRDFNSDPPYFGYHYETDAVIVNGVELSEQDQISWTKEGNSDIWSIRVFSVNASLLKVGSNTVTIKAYCPANWEVHCDKAEIKVGVEIMFEIELQGKDAGYNVPVTGSNVELKAVFDDFPQDKYSYVRFEWSVIDKKTGNVDERKETTSPTLTYIPTVGMHGNKTITCRAILEDKTTKQTLPPIVKSGDFMIFFRHDAVDGMPGQGQQEPNWYYWWKKDGAVPELNRTVYNPSLGSTAMHSAGTVYIGKEAGKGTNEGIVNGSNGLTFWIDILGHPRIEFYGGVGQDTIHGLAATVAHEFEHRRLWLDQNPRPGQGRGGIDANVSFEERTSLDGTSFTVGTTVMIYRIGTNSELIYWQQEIDAGRTRSHGDGVSEREEHDGGYHDTWRVLTDTWNLSQGGRWGTYQEYGDNELRARLVEQRVLHAKIGVERNDWSSQGSQAANKHGVQTTRTSSSSALQGLGAAVGVETVAMAPEIFISNYATVREEVVNVLSPLAGEGITYSDTARDINGNGKFDELVISVTLDIPRNGNYAFSADLYGAGDVYMTNLFAEFNLTAGTRTIDLHFDGKVIGTLGIDGPYELDLRVYDNTNIIEGGVAVHTTQAYRAADFEQLLGVTVTGETPTDTNGNGLYDTLTIRANIVAPAAGTYNFGGYLYSSTGELITYVSFSQELTVGNNQVVFFFSGPDIALSQVSGPYSLCINSFVGKDAVVFSGENLYRTALYLHTQFEGSQATFSGTFSDTAKDTNEDGKFDVLTIDVGLNVAMTGRYEIIASLQDGTGNYAGSASVIADLVTGMQTVTLEFESIYLFAGMASMSWTLSSLMLYDVNADLLLSHQADAYTTAVYQRSNFQSTGIAFTGQNSDIGQDTNSNGKYDYLNIDLGISITTAGTYSLSALLVDNIGNTIGWHREDYNLGLSDTSIRLQIEGREIWIGQHDGPYRIAGISMRNEDGNLVAVGNTYETDVYTFDQFEGFPIYINGEITEELVEGNEYGYLDLAITVPVFIDYSGSYHIVATLADEDGEIITSTTLRNVSLAGNQTHAITLCFDGAAIYQHGKSGHFIVTDLTIRLPSGQRGDTLYAEDVYQTTRYNADVFFTDPPANIDKNYPTLTGLKATKASAIDAVTFTWTMPTNHVGKTDRLRIEVFAPDNTVKALGIVTLEMTESAGQYTYSVTKASGLFSKSDITLGAVTYNNRHLPIFTITIAGLQKDTKYTLFAQARNSQLETASVPSKIIASTSKYVAVKITQKQSGEGSITLSWLDANEKSTTHYIVEVFDAKGKLLSSLEQEGVSISAAPTSYTNGGSGTVFWTTATTMTITGLASQKYTFVVKAVVGEVLGGYHNIFQESVTAKISVAPNRYDAVKSLKATAGLAAGTVVLEWAAVPGAPVDTKYEIFVQDSKGNYLLNSARNTVNFLNESGIGMYDGKATRTIITGLASEKYTFSVQAVTKTTQKDRWNDDIYTRSAIAKTIGTPSKYDAVKSLKAVAGSAQGTIRLTWNALPNALGYRILVQDTKGNVILNSLSSTSRFLNLIGMENYDGIATEVLITGLEPQKYAFVVQAYRDVKVGTMGEGGTDRMERTYSAGAKVSALPRKYAGVTGLRASDAKPNSVKLSWDTSDGANRYDIAVCDAKGNVLQPSEHNLRNIDNTGAYNGTATSLLVTGLTAGTKYTFVVYASKNEKVGTNGEGGTDRLVATRSSAAKTSASTAKLPALKVSTKDVKHDALTLTWERVANAYRYEIYVVVGKKSTSLTNIYTADLQVNGNPTATFSNLPTMSSNLNSNLKAKTNYAFVIYAFDSSGNRVAGGKISVTTASLP